MRKNYGAMTQQEKKFNKAELQSYKQGHHMMKSMVPGIFNLQTVGSSPVQKLQQAYAQGTPVQSGKGLNLNLNGMSEQKDLLRSSNDFFLQS